MSEKYPNARTKWTDEEVARLKKLYSEVEPGGTGKYTIEDLSEILGRSPSSIRNKAYELGITNPKHWSSEELTLLKKTYSNNNKRGHIKLDKLSEKLDRLPSNICRKAKELGLTNENRDVSKELREDFRESQKEWFENHEHPKGFLGKTHNPESFDERRVDRVETECPTCGQALYVRPKELENGHTRYCSLQCAYDDPNRSPQTKQAIKKQLETKRKNGNLAHNNAQGKREDLGGQYFRSTWEANYARYLNLQNIKWEYEPQTFEFEPIKRGTRFYTPDFYLSDEDRWVEVKGWFNQKSQTKIKRFKKYHKEEFDKLTMVVRSLKHKNASLAKNIGVLNIESYNAIKEKVGGLIPNWE